MLLAAHAGAIAMNIVDSEFIRTHPPLEAKMGEFRRRFASLAHNETTTLYFYGDSTVRNVFCALCVAMASQHGLGPLWTGDLFSEVTRCAGAIGRAPVRAFYWSRLGSFAPLRLPEDRVPLTPTVAFLGLGLWLTWPTPFLSTREWAGYDTWSAYEDVLEHAVRVMGQQVDRVVVLEHAPRAPIRVCILMCMARALHACTGRPGGGAHHALDVRRRLPRAPPAPPAAHPAAARLRLPPAPGAARVQLRRTRDARVPRRHVRAAVDPAAQRPALGGGAAL